MEAAPLTVGTAGHIDHGKTALVRALTGRDTDRLAEERRRGMSIELGFAPLELGGRRLSLVDVPGHERFVRTMIAGASGIDLFLLAVAADDGPMPQTREHLAVLRALGVRRGVVVVTKVDLVDAGRRDEVAATAEELAAAAGMAVRVVRASARSREGIEEVRAALAAVAANADGERDGAVAAGAGGGRGEAVAAGAGAVAAAQAPEAAEANSGGGGRAAGEAAAAGEADGRSRGTVANEDAPVLHVDRVFSVAGHGTVVTGTLWSGRLERGQRVLLLPSGREARVRSLEVHDERLEVAAAHQRVAINLAGIGREEVRRGDVVTVAGSGVTASYRLDAELKSDGAAGIAAERRVQVHLGTRAAPARVVDLGAGAVQLRLEQPLHARRGDRLVVRRIAPPDTLGGGVVRDASPPRHGPNWSPPPRDTTPAEVAEEPAMRVKRQPQRRGAAEDSARSEPSELARALLAQLERSGDCPPGAAELARRAGAERRQVERALGELVAAGAAVRLKADVVYPAPAYERLRDRVLALASEAGSTSIAEVRDALGLSRKYAQALLEQLDGERLLRRDGDRHYPRRPPHPDRARD